MHLWATPGDPRLITRKTRDRLKGIMYPMESDVKKKTRIVLVVALTAIGAAVLGSCVTDLASLVDTASLVPGTQARSRVTNEDAIAALRDALKTGVSSASSRLSLTDGYFGDAAVKILMPPEAKPLIDSVSKIPQGQKLLDDVVLRINRSAEEAAKEVVPIFVDAIVSMTIQDGIAIVKGGDRAATTYLESKTRAKLMDLYRPKVDTALAKPLVMDVSAKKSWDVLTRAYNKAGTIPNQAARIAGKKEPMPAVTVDLATYATGKALDGLFLKIGEEEGKIRKNPLDYASSMIKKVFGALKNGLL